MKSASLRVCLRGSARLCRGSTGFPRVFPRGNLCLGASWPGRLVGNRKNPESREGKLRERQRQTNINVLLW